MSAGSGRLALPEQINVRGFLKGSSEEEEVKAKLRTHSCAIVIYFYQTEKSVGCLILNSI